MPICRFCDIAYMDGESHSCHKYYWKWSAFKRVRVPMPSSENDWDEPLPPYVWISPTLYYSGLRSKDPRPVSSTRRYRFAKANGVLDAVDKFVRSLPESTWYRR